MSQIEPGTMNVAKRTGEREEVSFDKITKRIKKLSQGLHINPMELAQTIISQIYDGISTMQIDELGAELCASRMTVHPDYGILAKRIIISNHHKNTSPSFSEVIQQLWDNVNIHGKHTPIINEKLYKMTMENKAKINTVLDYEKDYNFDYFGFKTLERSYLLKVNGKVVERPQHMIMRVCLGIHKDDIKEAIKSYKMMADGYFTHATPTLFNVGTQREQSFSCFLLQMHDDSMSGIYKTVSDCAIISKYAGGIGLALHKVRAKGSLIGDGAGTSNGIVPMLRVYNATARYANQMNKRKGSFAMYLEPWHADIENFLHLRRNTGAEEERARDLFYAMWIPDLFMERVRANADWTLMCPHECPGLYTTYGDDFKELYERYEAEGRGRCTIKAQKIWQTMIDSQIETGTPYIGYKDHVNRKSNQKNLGVIQSSNLCVIGDTILTTRNGDFPIQELLDQEVEVWNGKEWSSTIVRKTGENKEVIKVSLIDELGNIKYIECTPYHKFYVIDKNNNELIINANNLKKNNVLCKWFKPSKNTEKILIEDIEYKVLSIKYTDKYCDTYCVNEPKQHKAMFNGIVTGNCNEINEYTAPDEHAVCCLLSIALPKYLEPVEVSEPVLVYTKSDCKYCLAAKNVLNREGITYEEINLDDEEIRKTTINELNKKILECGDGVCKVEGGIINTVPQIYFGNRRIGGYKELLDELKPKYNFEKLHEATKMAVRNLNKLIDYNYYPVPETETSNRRHRPIGIGIQGLADVFAKLRIPFDSSQALELNREISEHMYLAACQASMEIARKRKKYIQDYRRLIKKLELNPTEFTNEEKEKMLELKDKYFIYPDEIEKLPMSHAGAYSTFIGSPASQGLLQFDLWDVEPSPQLADEWKQVKDDIKKHGLRNSLLMALMPTASTSQILGNNECFEPYTNNIYTRQTLAGTFTIINKHLIQDCIDLGIWTPELKDRIVLANGSIQDIDDIPNFIKELYKVVWEIKQKWIVDHAVARGPFICQTQSMNIFMNDPTPNKINKLHFYAWEKGLKTGIYYLRSKAKAQGQKFSIDMTKYNKNKNVKLEEECLSCTA